MGGKHFAQLLNYRANAIRLGRGAEVGVTDGGVNNGIHH
jgi:hypothetical protein